MKFDIRTKIKSLRSAKDNRHFIAGFILILCISVYVSHQPKVEPEKTEDPEIFADTILPKGYILFPVRLENIEAIKGVIHQFGIVDVFTAASPGKTSKKVLSKVKILQAPYNPNEYALVLPESQSGQMMAEVGPFFGVIQNRSVSTEVSEITQKRPVKNIQIEYQQGI